MALLVLCRLHGGPAGVGHKTVRELQLGGVKQMQNYGRSNIRQLSQAWQMYSDDSNGQLPAGTRCVISARVETRWDASPGEFPFDVSGRLKRV